MVDKTRVRELLRKSFPVLKQLAFLCGTAQRLMEQISAGLKYKIGDERNGGMIPGPGAGWPARSAGQKRCRRQ